MEDQMKNTRLFMKAMKDRAGGYKNFYRLVHGVEPTKQQVQNITNYVNRSNYTIDFVFKVIRAFDQYHVTFDELFNGKEGGNNK